MVRNYLAVNSWVKVVVFDVNLFGSLTVDEQK